MKIYNYLNLNAVVVVSALVSSVSMASLPHEHALVENRQVQLNGDPSKARTAYVIQTRTCGRVKTYIDPNSGPILGDPNEKLFPVTVHKTATLESVNGMKASLKNTSAIVPLAYIPNLISSTLSDLNVGEDLTNPGIVYFGYPTEWYVTSEFLNRPTSDPELANFVDHTRAFVWDSKKKFIKTVAPVNAFKKIMRHDLARQKAGNSVLTMDLGSIVDLQLNEMMRRTTAVIRSESLNKDLLLFREGDQALFNILRNDSLFKSYSDEELTYEFIKKQNYGWNSAVFSNDGRQVALLGTGSKSMTSDVTIVDLKKKTFKRFLLSGNDGYAGSRHGARIDVAPDWLFKSPDQARWSTDSVDVRFISDSQGHENRYLAVADGAGLTPFLTIFDLSTGEEISVRVHSVGAGYVNLYSVQTSLLVETEGHFYQVNPQKLFAEKSAGLFKFKTIGTYPGIGPLKPIGLCSEFEP